MIRGLARRPRRRLAPALARSVAGSGNPKRALLLYSAAAHARRAPTGRHQNVVQQRELARALGELGFDVDAADFDETRRSLLRHDYDLVVDLHPREAPLYAGRLRPGALRIAYMTGSDPDFSNRAERARLDDLERRRHARLAPRRQVEDWKRERLEGFDALFYFGDDVTLSTYAGVRLPPVHRLPNHGWDVAPTDPERRDPHRLLFLGGFGQVHKGLDLLLEAVAGVAGLELVVCSPVHAEPDFEREYHRELRATPGIHLAGAVDVRGEAFRAAQSTCGWMVFPSCSEGQAGSVTAALSFGLPCAVSARCGFDHPEIPILADADPVGLRRQLLMLAATPRARLIEIARAAHALQQRHYRPQHYAVAVREALANVLAAAPHGAAR